MNNIEPKYILTAYNNRNIFASKSNSVRFLCIPISGSKIIPTTLSIWDRKFDFLKSVMVAPVGRITIFVGKLCFTTNNIASNYGDIDPFRIIGGIGCDFIAALVSFHVLIYNLQFFLSLNLDHPCGSPYVELVLVYLSSPCQKRR